MENIVLEERNDIRGSYLVAVGCEEGSYKEEMLKNSKIAGLLPVTGQDFNGKHELWFETAARQALKLKFSQKAPGVEEITELIRQLGTLAQRLEEYLLEPEELVPRLSCIFEGEGGEFLFVYVPGYNRENPSGICRLLEELMEYVDYEDHRAVSFLYLLHARSRQQACGIFTLHRLCGEILEAAQAEEKARKEEDLFGEWEEPETAVEEKNKSSWRNRAAGRRKETEKSAKSQNGKNSAEKGAKSRNVEYGAEKGAKCCNVRNGAEKGEKSWNVENGTEKGAKNQNVKNSTGKGAEGWSVKESAGAWEKGERQKAKSKETENKKAESKKAESKGKISESFRGLLQKMKSYIRGGAGETDEFGVVLEEPEAFGEIFGETCADTVLLAQDEFSETVLLTRDEDTVLLQEQEYCVLEPTEKERESILVESFPFCIGKEEAERGYALKEATISRRHAKIIREGTGYFIIDTKSLNGTYLNGERLIPDEKKELKNEDRIDFADIGFIFTCRKTLNGI